jgi:hypothetical protein
MRAKITSKLWRDARRSCLLVLGLLVVAHAHTPALMSAALSQGYNAKESIAPGTIVSLDRAVINTVQPATQDNVEELLGVIVPSAGAVLSLSSGSESEVQVATNGLTAAAVTNLNGDIRAGDKITVSPLAGIGMKAVESTKVLGVAQADFDANTPNVASREVKDKTGQTKTAVIGQIPVLVEVSYFVSGSGDQNTLVPSFVQDLANTVAGKHVSILRIGLAAGLLLFALLVVGLLIFGSVHSSIISIGRNPLSQKAIFRSLLSVILVSGALLSVTLGAVYLILSR